MRTRSLSLAIQGRAQHWTLLNPFKAEIIAFFNYVTNTDDTVYDGKTPTLAEIESMLDELNGEII